MATRRCHILEFDAFDAARKHYAAANARSGCGPQLFREVVAVKIAISGVISPPPQVGHATFAAVSTTSKVFLQRAHMNAYVGIGSLPAQLPAFASRVKSVWI